MTSRCRLAIGGIASLAIAVLVACASGSDDVSPWVVCTTNPCQPLALLQLPTPPALSVDASLAAACVVGAGEDDADGILVWHTDWDPVSQLGMCVTRDEAEDFGIEFR